MTPKSEPVIAVVSEVERVAIHHATLGVEAFGPHTCVEVLDHLRGSVGGQHLRAEPGGWRAQAAGPTGDVEECLAHLQSRQPSPLVLSPFEPCRTDARC
jgi:hypothetical protein